MHIVRSGTLLGTLALVMACAPPPQPVAERAQAAAVATPLD
jgi:hypothetical protein